MSLLSWLLVVLAGLCLAAMVVSLIVANRSAREARATIFPIVREEEATRARRARIASSVMGVIAAIMAGAFFVSGKLPVAGVAPLQVPDKAIAVEEPAVIATQPALPPAETLPVPTAEQEIPTSSLVVLATVQPPSSETPTPLATSTSAAPTLTPSPIASATSTRIPPSPTRASSPVAAPPNVIVGPVTFAAQINDRREAISPTLVFSDTLSRVYAVFPYSGMRNGLTWTQVWYFNDVEFNRDQESWKWGSSDHSYVFTKLVGAGDYRLELFVNDELAASGDFSVQGPLAVGGPRTQETPEGLATAENLPVPVTPERP